ncbi:MULTISPECIES: hypothetical protein [Streptomyces]|uniref:hypothetical protein n=1 Tax=Streptomyces TaxID=1883 RepID=UPI00110887EA|nr:MULTISPECIES: hypothetical protein [Streptomyces]
MDTGERCRTEESHFGGPAFTGNAAAGGTSFPGWPLRQLTSDRLSRNRFFAATVNPCPAPCASETDGARITDRCVNLI